MNGMITDYSRKPQPEKRGASIPRPFARDVSPGLRGFPACLPLRDNLFYSAFPLSHYEHFPGGKATAPSAFEGYSFRFARCLPFTWDLSHLELPLLTIKPCLLERQPNRPLSKAIPSDSRGASGADPSILKTRSRSIAQPPAAPYVWWPRVPAL